MSELSQSSVKIVFLSRFMTFESGRLDLNDSLHQERARPVSPSAEVDLMKQKPTTTKTETHPTRQTERTQSKKAPAGRRNCRLGENPIYAVAPSCLTFRNSVDYLRVVRQPAAGK